VIFEGHGLNSEKAAQKVPFQAKSLDDLPRGVISEKHYEIVMQTKDDGS